MDGYAAARYAERFFTSTDSNTPTSGRIYKVDHRQCIISDLTTWSEEMGDCMRGRFPACQITIQHTTASMTGFVVVVILDRPRAATVGTVLLAISVIALLVGSTLLLLQTTI